MAEHGALFDLAHMLGKTVAELDDMTLAELHGWIEWGKQRAKRHQTADSR